MTHGMPRPRNTLHVLEPIMLPIAASALSSLRHARRDANVSGSDVPSATMDMPVITSDRPMEQPNISATSLTIAISRPSKISAMAKHGNDLVRDGDVVQDDGHPQVALRLVVLGQHRVLELVLPCRPQAELVVVAGSAASTAACAAV
eukprot:352205-Chlamydomonas_euryale.AAC.3